MARVLIALFHERLLAALMSNTAAVNMLIPLAAGIDLAASRQS